MFKSKKFYLKDMSGMDVTLVAAPETESIIIGQESHSMFVGFDAIDDVIATMINARDYLKSIDNGIIIDYTSIKKRFFKWLYKFSLKNIS